MKCEIHGDKLLITESIMGYINEKLNRLNKYFTDDKKITARVVFKVRGHNQIVEVTIPIDSYILRNEESNEDLYAAIDLVIDKLERQIVKNKTKLKSKALKTKNIKEKNEEPQETIIKRKKLETKPMTDEEAILQMNLLGHDFFIYNEEGTNSINVLYKRKDGNYGVIETK